MAELKSPKPGLKVSIKCEPSNTGGMLIADWLLKNRKETAVGTIWDYVPGHGGDVWYVVHEGTPIIDDNGTPSWDKSGVSVYTVFEMEETTIPF